MIDIEAWKRLKKTKGRKLRILPYLRRSAGEGGSTAEQLKELENYLVRLENAGVIAKVDREIVGRDPTKMKWKGVDLERKGGILNEGEAQSGFSVANRPVFMHGIDLVRDGKYDGMVAVSMDRFARNYGALSRYAYDLWGEMTPPRLFYGFAEGRGLGEGGPQGIISEKVLSSLMEWGGLAKLLEIQKAESKRTGTNVDRGYLVGSRPEWLGYTYKGKTSKGTPYREAWEAIREGKGASSIARAARKFATDGSPQTSWTRTWKPKLLAYDRLGVLGPWLSAYEAVNQYIREIGGYPKNAFKSKEVGNILRSTAGFFAYPAGVLIKTTDGTQEFVLFPNPLDIGIDRLAGTKDALEIDEFVVERSLYDGRELEKVQTQPRAGERQKKK